MENRGNNAYTARVQPQPVQPAPENYQPKRASYRRPIEPQPIPIRNEIPGAPNSISNNSARPVAPASLGPNGVSRASSHRRRQSQQVPPPGTSDAMPQLPVTYTPPAAPEVPRGPPPTSYRDPYGPKGASRSHIPTRTYSGRSRDPPIQMNPNRQQPNIRIPVDAAQPSQGSPVSPLDPLSATLKAGVRRDSARRPSVPDRSPLQTLEGKLDDISKEEKRARMEEAEWAAQKRAEAERRARRAREAAGQTDQMRTPQRNFSGSAVVSERLANTPGRTGSTRRHVSMPSQTAASSQAQESPVIGMDISEPWDPAGGAGPQTTFDRSPGQQSHRLHHVDRAIDRIPGKKGNDPVGVNRGPSFRDRTGDPRDAAAGGSKIAAPTQPRGLGLYGMSESPPNASRPVGGGVSRYDSKRLSKDLPPTPKEESTGVTKARDSRGIMAAQREMEQQRLSQAQRQGSGAGGPTTTEPARHRVGFATAEPSTDRSLPPAPIPETDPATRQSEESDHSQHDSRLWNHEPDRRYQPRPLLEEWRSAPAATLYFEDLDLDVPETDQDGKKTAWWEEPSPDKKRRSTTYPQTGYDGYIDEPSGQTSFNPPLYLKCGPLLRYTGMRKEKRGGHDREIWRGSIMIVTTDADSSYVKPPTLRLFKQSMDLLPPPPAEVGDDGRNLNPAYVDPVEGQIKVSRTGKTLYVKKIEEITPGVDLSRAEDDRGLFQESRITTDLHGPGSYQGGSSRVHKKDGEKLGKVREIPGIRLHAEQGVTFWRFNLEVELSSKQERIAYRINRGPAIGFWVPARGETMNIMFHSCNGFSLSVNPNDFCGPDPLWRDVLNTHQTRPFHVMLGGGDQVYNDICVKQTTIFRKWTESKNPLQKHDAPFSEAMQEELEKFYLDRYSMWFSQGLFGMANSQIPMVNIWDDHDIIDGYGSYPHHFMSTPVFTGLGAVAFKYYMLFQHQSIVAETEKTEPSWILGAEPGPYIKEHSRSVFMFLGRQVAFLGLDTRTERRRDEVLSEESYNLVLDRVEDEITKGETKHLLVLLGVPIAYPRLNFLENILTSRVMDPIKALGRYGMLGNFVNKFDGGVEILDDLDDHWTAKHHKEERSWFITQLQQIAAEKSVRVTILGGDVHLAGAGQFYSNKKMGVPKDKDHRYMPNVISSAIANTPPSDMLADILNKRNKVHHLDPYTDEDMIPMFMHDVDDKRRNNNTLLPRRNWCSLREYQPGTTPLPTPNPSPPGTRDGPRLIRTLSDSAPGQMVRRLSRRGRSDGPPVAYYNRAGAATEPDVFAPRSRRSSISSLFRRRASVDSVSGPPGSAQSAPMTGPGAANNDDDVISRPNPFVRRPTVIGKKAKEAGFVNLQGGLDICWNVEISREDPAGISKPYRLLVPALDYTGPDSAIERKPRQKSRLSSIFSAFGGGKRRTMGDDGYSQSGSEISDHSDAESELGEVEDPRARKEREEKMKYRVGPRMIIPSFSRKKDRDVTRDTKRDSGTTSGYHTNPGSLGTGPAASASLSNGGGRSTGRITARDIAMDEVTSYPDRRASAPQPSNIPVPTASYGAPQTTAPSSRPLHHSTPYHTHSRGPSIQHNSSHRSQLPAPPAPQPQPTSHHHHHYHHSHQPPDPEPEVKVHRRSMGGILNQHRDKHFERDAHVLTHTPSTNTRSKRESYPPHPAIVGAGPGSPYARVGDAAGVGARYLGGGRYEDDDDNDSLESSVDGGGHHLREGKHHVGSGGVMGRKEGGNRRNSWESSRSGGSLSGEDLAGKKKKGRGRWKIWKVL